MNGIIYSRVSSKEQIEGTSLESQESACRDYARSHQIEILKVFVERGESAKFADRTQLIELINFCHDNKGKVDVLLVWKVDRFARNVTDHFSVKAGLGKYGVKVLSVTEPIGANPEGKLMETILAGFAQFDNDVRATRTTQGMRRRLQEGIFPRRAPLGYKHSSKNHTKKTEPDEPDGPTFSILQRVWKMFATGGYTKAEICGVARRLGLRTRNGISLPRQSLDHIFANKFYAGIIVDFSSGEEYQCKHVPMITLEEFFRVQSIISKKRHAQPHRREREEFPLRGTVRCPECHSYLTGGISRGNGGRYSYYHCYKKNCLRRRSYSPADVHGEFQGFLDQLAPTKQLISKVGDLIVELAHEANEPKAKQRARDEAELRHVKTQLHELFRLKLDGLLTDDEFLAQKSSLVSHQSTLEAAIVDLVMDENSIRAKLAEITDPLVSLRKTWDALPIQLKRRFKQFLLGFGYLHRSIRTAETPILFKLFHPFSTSNARLVAPTGGSWNQIVQEIEEFAELIREWRGEKTAV